MMTNYKGRPFMLASTENPAMLYSLLACIAGVFVCAFEVIPQVRDYNTIVVQDTNLYFALRNVVTSFTPS